MSESRRTGPEAPEQESALVIAERHVRECKARVAEQLRSVKDLQAGRDHEEAKHARRVLALFEDALAAARKHLESERRRASAEG